METTQQKTQDVKKDKSSVLADLSTDIYLAEDKMINILMKVERSIKDSQKIVSFLNTMEHFIELLKKGADNYKELVYAVSFALKYEILNIYNITFKYGEKGEKFYIILKGKVSIIVPKEKYINLTKEEYIRHLQILKENDEIELLNKCIFVNKHIYYIEARELDSYKIPYYISSPKSRNSNNIKNDKNHTTIDEYINRYTPWLNPDSDDVEKRQVTIYHYCHIVSLRTGDVFGELALQSYTQKRTATIITEDECHFGILDKKSYDYCIKGSNDKMTTLNLNFIHSLPLFRTFTKHYFHKTYASYFIHRKLIRYDKLMKEKQEAMNIYFIKEGEYEITMNKSLQEINEMIRYLGGVIEDDKSDSEVYHDDPKFYHYMTTVKKLTKVRSLI